MDNINPVYITALFDTKKIYQRVAKFQLALALFVHRLTVIETFIPFYILTKTKSDDQ